MRKYRAPRHPGRLLALCLLLLIAQTTFVSSSHSLATTALAQAFEDMIR